MTETKMVVVIRKDLKMRRGKEISQGNHSILMWLTNRIKENPNTEAQGLLTQEELEWVNGNYAKICLQVDSEKELLDIHQKALDAGLTVNLVCDLGITEFGGQKTNTCIAIGPHYNHKIDPITSKLKLY